MTWKEFEAVAQNAISSELGNIPKTMAERVAKRIIEDVKIEFAKEGHPETDMRGNDIVVAMNHRLAEECDKLLRDMRGDEKDFSATRKLKGRPFWENK